MALHLDVPESNKKQYSEGRKAFFSLARISMFPLQSGSLEFQLLQYMFLYLLLMTHTTIGLPVFILVQKISVLTIYILFLLTCFLLCLSSLNLKPAHAFH